MVTPTKSIEIIIKVEVRKLKEPKSKPNNVIPIAKSDKKFKRGGSLLKYIKKEVGMEVTGKLGLAKSNAIQIQAVGKALTLNSNLFQEYVKWMKEQHQENDRWLKTINHGGLNPDSKLFSRFMADMSLEMPSASAIDKHFKLLTESKIEKAHRIKKEQDRQKKRELEQQKEALEVAKAEEDCSWGNDCINKIFEDPKNNAGFRLRPDDNEIKISWVINRLQKVFGKNWQEPFKKFAIEVEDNFQKIINDPEISRSDKRNNLYPKQFKVESEVWHEVFPQK